LKLDSLEARKRVMDYRIIFRTFVPEKFLTTFGLDKGFGVRRAMIFSKPPVFRSIFDILQIPFPGDLTRSVQRGSTLYKENTKKPALPPIVIPSETLIDNPNEHYYNQSAITPNPNRNGLKAATPTTPFYNESGPKTPPFGGGRKTPRNRVKRSKTRKNNSISFITSFSKIWARYRK
jgi:hypothetical protein